MPTIYRILDATTGEHLVSVVGPRDAVEAETVLDWLAIELVHEIGGDLMEARKMLTVEVGDTIACPPFAEPVSLHRLAADVWQTIRRYFVGKEAA